MENPIHLFLFFLVVFISVLICQLKSLRTYRNSVKDAVNHNFDMTSFLFRIPMTKDEILRSLRTKAGSDILDCSADSEGCTALFSHPLEKNARYLLTFLETGGVCLLWLDEIRSHMGGIHGKLNSFFIEKLNAEIIPYMDYDQAKHRAGDV